MSFIPVESWTGTLVSTEELVIEGLQYLLCGERGKKMVVAVIRDV